MKYLIALVLCLVISAYGFTTTATFPDYRSGPQTMTVAVPNSLIPGSGMSIEVRGKGDLNQDGPEYIGMTIDGTTWIWLDEVDANDPFYTYPTSYGPSDPGDIGQSGPTMIGVYYAPYALAQSWVADGFITINDWWGSQTSYLVGGDYFQITFTFNPGSVVGDPHVKPIYADSFELNGNGIFNFFADEQLTINGRTSEPYHGFFVTEVAVLFDNHDDNQWAVHCVVDQHYVPHVYFNDVEILPGTFLLGGNLRFTDRVETLGHIEGQANEGYLRSVLHIDVLGSGLLEIRVGIDELAGGYFELVFSPFEQTTEERSVRGGMLMMSERARSEGDVASFAIDDIFAVPELH